MKIDLEQLHPQYRECLESYRSYSYDSVYLDHKWAAIRKPVQPNPREFQETDYAPRERLTQKFKEHGLQIAVKIASIDLTPDKPEFPANSWHVS